MRQRDTENVYLYTVIELSTQCREGWNRGFCAFKPAPRSIHQVCCHVIYLYSQLWDLIFKFESDLRAYNKETDDPPWNTSLLIQGFWTLNKLCSTVRKVQRYEIFDPRLFHDSNPSQPLFVHGFDFVGRYSHVETNFRGHWQCMNIS